MVTPRMVLVDNYDSYTFNLAQLMSRVYGEPPTVIRNDDPRLLELAASADLVVISPGPGDPNYESAFGLCGSMLRRLDVPVLGVCLGHQGIAVAAGGTVSRAPQARHGHVSRVRHSTDPLFAGIPDEFAAVRYHSLRVDEPLPEELVPLAWAEDGVLMALRHRDRPWWGVQFHPESVLTEYGGQLLSNVRNIASPSPAPAAPVPVLGDPPRTRSRTYQAHVRLVDAEPDPETVFARLFQSTPYTAWLDSVPAHDRRGRFSYLCQASDELGEVLSYRIADGAVTVERVGSGRCRVPGSIFEALRTELADRTVHAPELPFDFVGGFIGYFGYELKAECGAHRAHRAESPDAMWLFPDRMAVFDHLDGRCFLLALSEDNDGSRHAALAWLDKAERVLLGIGTADTELERLDIDEARVRGLAESFLVRNRERYLADVSYCQEKLREGESYEICLTNAVRLPRLVEPWAYYRSLRRHNPAPYSAYLNVPGLAVASSSPERFLKITKDRVVETKPIKGTARRSRTPQEDAKLRLDLATSEKTRAENLMIVDLLRNDLSQVCAPGSVHVPLLMQVESYQTVHQLVSTIRGQLRPDASVIDCVRACFPGGSMTGAPKLRTMEIIDELEVEARGVYSGAIGFLGCNGTADLNIAIRTAVFLSDALHVGAGGAIVLASEPEEEYEEMILKAVAPLRALLALHVAADLADSVPAGQVTS